MIRKAAAAVRILLFCLLLSAVLAGLTRLLALKESEARVSPFLRTAGEYDVLFFGDSQITYGVAPLEIYKKYGIPSYNLGNANSTMALTYWTMMNALQYASPKAVVIGVKDIELAGRIPDRLERVHQALDGFPMSRVKLAAVRDLASDATEAEETRRLLLQEMLFPLAKYHGRWRSLGAEDLHPAYNEQKGSVLRVGVTDPDEEHPLVGPEELAEEEGEGYVYLRRMIEECRRRGIGTVLMLAPHRVRPDSLRAAHTAGRIAGEYGVPMLNFADMDSVVDYYTDCYDPASHINPSGVRKVSDYLGRYLSEHFGLPDRRREEAYAHWQDEVDAYIDYKLTLFDEADDFRSRLMLMHDEDFSLVLTLPWGFPYSGLHTKDLLQNIAREHVFEGDGQRSREMKPLEVLPVASDEDVCYWLVLDRDSGMRFERCGEWEEEIETSFGYVFCRMNDWRIDLSLVQDETETYYFESDEDQARDIRAILIDRRTGKPARVLAFDKETPEELDD